MAANIIKTLFHFDVRSRHKVAGANCESIRLLGTGKFEVEVAGTARFQELLNELAPQNLPGGASRPVSVVLDTNSHSGGGNRLVGVTLRGREIGYCPAFLSTRYVGWLHEWGLQHARVACDARLMRKHGRFGQAGPLIVLMDIDPLFRMTAG